MSSGSGSQPQQQQVTQTTSNLPEYARPYFQTLMDRAGSNLSTEYQTYNAPRVAGFTPAQEQVQQNILGLQAPQQFGVGSALAQQAGLGALNMGNYAPGQFNAQQVNAPQLQQYGMAGPQMFGTQQAQQYMSPYMSQALEPQMREAITSAKRGQLTQDLGAARQGTYGGSRQLLAGMERERNLGQQLSDIQSRGMQSAYENAQAQFERDRTAGFNVGQQNLQSALQTQGLAANTGMQAALANQQQNLEAQRLGEQSRQFGSSQGLQGLQLAGQMGQTLGNLGQYQQTANLQRLQAQGSAAQQDQQQRQQYLDQAYADFLRQRDYPMEVLGQYSNLLRGLPMQLNTAQTTYAPAPSATSQILGTGLGALGLAKTLG